MGHLSPIWLKIMQPYILWFTLSISNTSQFSKKYLYFKQTGNLDLKSDLVG